MALPNETSPPNLNNNALVATHPLEELRRKALESMAKKKEKPEREEGEISDEEKNIQPTNNEQIPRSFSLSSSLSILPAPPTSTTLVPLSISQGVPPPVLPLPTPIPAPAPVQITPAVVQPLNRSTSKLKESQLFPKVTAYHPLVIPAASLLSDSEEESADGSSTSRPPLLPAPVPVPIPVPIAAPKQVSGFFNMRNYQRVAPPEEKKRPVSIEKQIKDEEERVSKMLIDLEGAMKELTAIQVAEKKSLEKVSLVEAKIKMLKEMMTGAKRELYAVKEDHHAVQSRASTLKLEIKSRDQLINKTHARIKEMKMTLVRQEIDESLGQLDKRSEDRQALTSSNLSVAPAVDVRDKRSIVVPATVETRIDEDMDIEEIATPTVIEQPTKALKTSAPVIQQIPEEPLTTEQSVQPQHAEDPFLPWETPLSYLKSFRFQDRCLEKSSASYSYKVHPKRTFCKFDLHGACSDPKCPHQHLRDVVISPKDTLEDLASYFVPVNKVSELAAKFMSLRGTLEYKCRELVKSFNVKEIPLESPFRKAYLEKQKKKEKEVEKEDQASSSEEAPKRQKLETSLNSSQPSASGSSAPNSLTSSGAIVVETSGPKYVMQESLKFFPSKQELFAPGDSHSFRKKSLGILARGLEKYRDDASLWLLYLTVYPISHPTGDLSGLLRSAVTYNPLSFLLCHAYISLQNPIKLETFEECLKRALKACENDLENPKLSQFCVQLFAMWGKSLLESGDKQGALKLLDDVVTLPYSIENQKDFTAPLLAKDRVILALYALTIASGNPGKLLFEVPSDISAWPHPSHYWDLFPWMSPSASKLLAEDANLVASTIENYTTKLTSMIADPQDQALLLPLYQAAVILDINQKNIASGRSKVQNYIVKHPKAWGFWHLYGLLEARCGQVSDACLIYQAGMKKHPTCFVLLNSWVTLSIENGQYLSALFAILKSLTPLFTNMDAVMKRVLLELEGLSHKQIQSLTQIPADTYSLIDELFSQLLEDKGSRELTNQGQEIREILSKKSSRPMSSSNVPILWLWFCAFSFYEILHENSRLNELMELCKATTAVSDQDKTDYLLLDFRRQLWIGIVRRVTVTSLPIVELFSSVTSIVDEISTEQDPILWTDFARQLSEIPGAISLLDHKLLKDFGFLNQILLWISEKILPSAGEILLEGVLERLCPDNTQLCYTLAEMFVRNGKQEDAIRVLQLSLSLVPNMECQKLLELLQQNAAVISSMNIPSTSNFTHM